MGFLPDIEEGKIKEEPKAPALFTPKATGFHARLREEELLNELNNMGRQKVTEDFSDSPVLNK